MDMSTLDDTEPESRSLVLLAKSLFHQCQIILHSMLVPLFSGICTGPEVGVEAVKRSAERVLRHTGLHEKLLGPFLYGDCDATLVPPLMGYGAFITGVVLLATEASCREKIEQATTTESRKLRAVRAILRLLNILRRHWRTLGHLVSRPYSIKSPARTDILVEKPSRKNSPLLWTDDSFLPHHRTGRLRTKTQWLTWNLFRLAI